MTLTKPDITTKATHGWWRKIRVAYVPGPNTPLLDQVAGNLLDYLR